MTDAGDLRFGPGAEPAGARQALRDYTEAKAGKQLLEIDFGPVSDYLVLLKEGAHRKRHDSRAHHHSAATRAKQALGEPGFECLRSPRAGSQSRWLCAPRVLAP